MSKDISVGVLIGSLSRHSINRKLFNALKKMAPKHGLVFNEIHIGNLPLYNHDLDDDYPFIAEKFKESLEANDAVLIITPEYNRSIPGALKNALDWASRPWGQNSLNNKPSAVIGASVGAIGTAVAQQQLRSLLAFLNSPDLNQPEAYIKYDEGLVDSEGNVTVESTREFLDSWLEAVRAHFDKFV